MASTYSGSSPCTALDSTCTPGSRAASRFISCRLRTPPPQTSRRRVCGCCASSASATVATVSSSRVACTSAAAYWPSPMCTSAQARWNCSRPVLFGGGSANHGSERQPASRPSSTAPLAAYAPSASKVRPVWRWHQASISALAGPVSKPRTAPSRGIRVRLAMPPRFSTARSSSAAPSMPRWKAGISGAPWPPAATSRRRKSDTVVIPVSSAMRLPSPSCTVKAGVASGRWRTVWPCEPIARTWLRSTPASASS